MKRFLMVLLVVFCFTGAAMAAETQRVLEFRVHVGDWIVMDMCDPEPLDIYDPNDPKVTSAFGTITSNTPWVLSISTTRVAEDKDINNWFYYRTYIDGKFVNGGNPGYGSVQNPRQPGEYTMSVDFIVESTHSLAGFPRPKPWYELKAGDYSSTMTLTLAAAN